MHSAKNEIQQSTLMRKTYRYEDITHFFLMIDTRNQSPYLITEMSIGLTNITFITKLNQQQSKTFTSYDLSVNLRQSQ